MFYLFLFCVYCYLFMYIYVVVAFYCFIFRKKDDKKTLFQLKSFVNFIIILLDILFHALTFNAYIFIYKYKLIYI